jgi:hypothetical protein
MLTPPIITVGKTIRRMPAKEARFVAHDYLHSVDRSDAPVASPRRFFVDLNLPRRLAHLDGIREITSQLSIGRCHDSFLIPASEAAPPLSERSVADRELVR